MVRGRAAYHELAHTGAEKRDRVKNAKYCGPLVGHGINVRVGYLGVVLHIVLQIPLLDASTPSHAATDRAYAKQ